MTAPSSSFGAHFTGAETRVGRIARWLRANLFSSWLNSAITVMLVLLLASLLWRFVDWALWSAIFHADADACRSLEGHGACWGVIAEKHRLILFGRFPHAEQWRPFLALSLMLLMVAISAWPRAWRPHFLLPMWFIGLPLFVLLMHGGVLGMSEVPSRVWGGLPLTVLLSVGGMALAFPIAVLVALGRRSEMPAIRAVCAAYVELIRGVPLISVLFMASFMFPLLVPQGVQFDVLLRVLLGIGLFAGAYLAEVIRGGLQAVPRSQLEAAQALGLNYWQTQRMVLLPQAFRAVLPSIVNSFISTFKDCSLVTIVSLHELTGALSLALGGDPVWRPFFLEGYLFVAFIYWAFCFGMSRYSAHIERRLSFSSRRKASTQRKTA